MTPERFQEVKKHLAAALERKLEERSAYLDRACTEPSLRQEVELLIAEHEQGKKPDFSPSSLSDLSEGATLTTLGSETAHVGVFIGPYQLNQQLGEGGMGVVFRATQFQPIRRNVALKIIKPGMDSKQVIARFESERQALALMDHPNIAHVFDAGTTATALPYFVMELVEGTPITCYCDSKQLTIKERIELFIPVCRAIQHAHQKGIIHRDIKPSNILVKQQENQAVPKVIDFGLAKALGQQLSEATMMTSLGTVVGTLDYMSPEQADVGGHDVDTRSDVYSMGAVLYEALTGTTPLDHGRLVNSSYVEALMYIREHEVQPPSLRLRRSTELQNAAELRKTDATRLPKLLHHDLDWILVKALEKDRSRRYETVNGLVRDLQRYLNGEPVEAAPPSLAYKMRKFVWKHRLGLATAAWLMMLLVSGVVVSAWMAVRANRAEAEARAVNDFLRNDLLAQASIYSQATPNIRPDPDLRVRTVLDRAAARIEGKFTNQPLVEASIRDTIGTTYTDLSLYPDGEHQLERAVELRQRILGEKNPDTLASMSEFARVLERQGSYAKAEPLYTQILQAQRRLFGAEDRRTLNTMSRLAATYLEEGKYTSAETIYSTLIPADQRVLGEENDRTLRDMANLATAYHFQNKYAQAEPLYLRALDLRRHVSGDEHPDTLIVLGNLAELYRDQGKYGQAEPLYRTALEIQTRLLGKRHRDTIYTMNSLAGLYRDEGEPARSEVLYSEALETERDGIGANHPFTLDTLIGLAHTYEIQRKYSQAEGLYIKALDIAPRVLGETHQVAMETFSSLGRVRLNQKEYREAELTLRDALNVFRKAGTETWQLYNCQSLLGASLAGQKKYAEAEPLLLSSYEGMLQRQATIPTGERSSLSEAGKRIINLYQDWGKPEEVVKWQSTIQAREAVLLR